MRQLEFTIEEIEEMRDLSEGVCISCGEVQDSCEPDACGYTCESCGDDTVYGSEELLLQGLVTII